MHSDTAEKTTTSTIDWHRDTQVVDLMSVNTKMDQERKRAESADALQHRLDAYQ